jgi:hypothetical protein
MHRIAPRQPSTVRSRAFALLSVLVVLAAGAFAPPAWAAPKPIILATQADLAAGTLTIQGENFGAVAPIVKLGGQALVVAQSSPTEIVATLPPGLTEGTYVLGVKRTGAIEVTSLVTVDVDTGSDGPGREIQDFASAIGGGPNPTPTFQFFAVPVEVTTTKSDQPVLVVSSNAFGTAGVSANLLNLFICYKTPSGPLTSVGNGIVGLRLPALTRVTQSINKIIHLPTPGTYLVGMCGSSDSPNWTDNDWGTTSALVF